MLDIKFIRENIDAVKKSIKARHLDVDADKLLALDEKRRKSIRELEDLQAAHNRISEEIASLPPFAREAKITESKELKIRVQQDSETLEAIQKEFEALLLEVPNILADGVPEGKDESENKAVRSWGEPKKFDFQPKDHVELGTALDVIDIARAGKVAGARFAYLKGGAALLEFALIQHVLHTLTSSDKVREIADTMERGYSHKPFVPVVPPVMIRPDVLKRMARLSEADKDERYHLSQDDLYLVGSAEHTIGSMHMDEILEECDLPLRYIGFSTSFRREAGSYGRDIRGILRMHQFDKLEMESFTAKDNALNEQNFFVAIQEYLMRSLEVPYRVVMICTGDMGKPDARQIDIEAWLPSQNTYRETHTSDYMADYQARRLNTRVRSKDGTLSFAHMNDATAFAIGRTIIAIMENYQQEDGSVRIPEVLRPYMGGKEFIAKEPKE